MFVSGSSAAPEEICSTVRGGNYGQKHALQYIERSSSGIANLSDPGILPDTREQHSC